MPGTGLLTPSVLGGKSSALFQRFEQTCAKAYITLRRQAKLFITLFAMMLSTGIPELESTRDIEYLRGAFALHLSETEAANEVTLCTYAQFVSLIHVALNTKSKQWDDMLHAAKHK